MAAIRHVEIPTNDLVAAVSYSDRVAMNLQVVWLDTLSACWSGSKGCWRIGVWVSEPSRHRPRLCSYGRIRERTLSGLSRSGALCPWAPLASALAETGQHICTDRRALRDTDDEIQGNLGIYPSRRCCYKINTELRVAGWVSTIGVISGVDGG